MTSAEGVKVNQKIGRYLLIIKTADVFGFHVSLPGNIFQDSSSNGLNGTKALNKCGSQSHIKRDFP